VLERYKVPASAAHMKSKRGEIVTWMPTPNICISVARGHGDRELGEQLRDGSASILQGRKGIHSFFDGLDFNGYDPAFRSVLNDSSKESEKSGQVASIWVLTRSKIVAMGSAVVSLMLDSKIQVVSSVETFEKQLIAVGGASALQPKGTRQAG
jgi:hypothetical protein